MPRPSHTDLPSTFQGLRSRREGALVAYLTGGDPNPREFLQNAAALAEGGADIIEIGIPFSDPIADGPVIQASSQRALVSGATPRSVLGLTRQLSHSYPRIPLVLLTYYNPILAMGLDKFMEKAHQSGASGTVVPDLPVEESNDYGRAALNHEVDTVFLTAPNTSKHRLEKIVGQTTGFLYLVSLFGVTGPRESLSRTALSSVKRVKDFSRNTPAVAGFGISKPEHVSALMQSGADGAIVGSALVRLVSENLDGSNSTPSLLKQRVSELKRATRIE